MKKFFIGLMGAFGAYLILCLISLCASVCFGAAAAIGIWMHQLSPLLLKLLYACYFLILGFALFYRTPLEQVFIWNPFESMRELPAPDTPFGFDRTVSGI